ncbi:MAG: hypothetical protein JWP31_1803 [Aeromicrobium sp.]|nr:hypothetical protein [Aeromicrobium sp.]
MKNLPIQPMGHKPVVFNDADISINSARGVDVDHDGAIVLADNMTVRLDMSIVEAIVAEYTAQQIAAAS